MQKLYKLFQFILFNCFVLAYTPAYSQQCEWLSVGGNPLNNEVAQVVAVDSENDAIVAGTFADSFSIGSQFIPKSTNSLSTTYIAKYNTVGTIKWVKTIQHTHTGAGGTTCSVNSITTDANNNIYISGTFGGDIDLGNSVTLSNGPVGRAFLAKYDSAGTAQWAVKIGGSNGVIGGHTTVDGAGNVYFGFYFSITAGFTGTTQTISTGSMLASEYDIGVVKYSSTGSFIKVAKFGSSDREYVMGIGIDAANNIYLSGSSAGGFAYAGKNLFGSGEIVLKFDTALVPIKGIKNDLNQGTNPTSYGIAVQASGNFALVNNFFDSVNFGNNVWLKSPWNGTTSHSLGIVYYDSSLTAIWARTNEAVSAAKPSIGASGGVSIRNDNIYVGGAFFLASTRLGNSTLNYKGGHQKLFITKMDTLGNFLWAFANEDSASRSFLWASTPDNTGNVYVTGGYSHKLTIFNKSAPGPNTTLQSNLYVAKITDYAIYRGQVSSGPYCAGDTLKIPYTKQGVYNIGNEFIAELSDSAGNFDGGQRELGRVTDTASGIINGSLPLFNVATTNKYRIRIISTSPVVQSYYKVDTLRLLIYSKDTANAGPDRYVCKGQKVRLGTTGGSRWEWSPTQYFTNPTDSTNRQPEIQLYDTAEFRIIISDSSGCGDIDTDYVKIYVRPYIQTTIQGDTDICRGHRQTLTGQPAGGDSANYWYEWREITFNIKLGTTKTLNIRPYNTTTYRLVVGDSCSEKIDTAYITIHVSTNLQAHATKDTAICKGKTATLTVYGTGCSPQHYTYNWYKNNNYNTTISSNDSIQVSPTTTTTYQVILKDTTTLLEDTARVTVTIDSNFHILVTPDSTICTGQSLQLKADVFSCDTSKMKYEWRANNQQQATNNTLQVSPTATTTYTVIGENTFNGLKDTATVTVTVRPPLQLTVNPDSTICIGEEAELRAIATGGRTNTHQITWRTNNQQQSTNNIQKVSPTATTTYTAVLSDGCTIANDSATITITVRPKLKITLNQDSTICIGEAAELRATTKGGDSTAYTITWQENNTPIAGNNPTRQESPTTTTIYKAVLSDGCTTPNDSATITITVRPPLSISLNSDSTICVGETAELRAETKGGDNTAHQIQWTMDKGPWTSTNPIQQVNPTVTTTYKAVLSDGCTKDKDSANITITVRPPLQITATAPDSICSNQILLLTATPTGGNTVNHNIQWTTDNSPYKSNQNPATDTPQINTRYIATLSDNCSPTVSDTVTVTVLPVPKAGFTVQPQQGCPPLTVTIEDQSTDNDTTQNMWNVGGAEYQSKTEIQHLLTQTGTYNITLTVSNALGCNDQATQLNAITVLAKPQAAFSVKPDIKEIEEPIYLYNHSRQATNIIWEMGNGQQLNPQQQTDTTYQYPEEDTGVHKIKLIATNSQGCKDTAEQTVIIYDKVNCVIPTAFTPNTGDNLNPTFAPVCVGVAYYTLTIYNRWGQVIYQRANGQWDGTYSDQPVPAGVYLYKIQMQADSKKKKLTYGTIQVIR